MKTTQLDEKQRRQLAIMRSSGEALLALINDVLDMAKLDAGQVRLECEPVEIDEILASVESTVHASVLKKDLRFEMDVDLSPHGRAPSTPAAIIENGTRADQVIVKGTLGSLSALVDEANIKGPALLVIGEVAARADGVGLVDVAARAKRAA